MSNLFYTKQQWKVFAGDLLDAFINLGFEIVEKPYLDHALLGFRATYIRRYFLQNSASIYDDSLVTLVHVVGLPFGRWSEKMVVLSSPRDIQNEPVCPTVRLRLHIGDDGQSHVIFNKKRPTASRDSSFNIGLRRRSSNSLENLALTESSPDWNITTSQLNVDRKLLRDLMEYVSNILELISPGLIQLPIEMKLEILKRLSVGSVIRMAQVNNEFRTLIFKHGESLWKHLCLRDFNVREIDRRRHQSWVELYKELYILHQIEVCRKERALPGLPDRPALPPAPYRLQIGWLPEVLQLPFYPIDEEVNPIDDRLQLALQSPPLRRAESLDSVL